MFLAPPPLMFGADYLKNPNPPEKLINETDLVQKTPQTSDVTARTLSRQIDYNVGNHSTSNAMYNAVIGPGGISTKSECTKCVNIIRYLIKLTGHTKTIFY